MTRIQVLTPTYKPVGGVVKIFDYVAHALDLGHEVVVNCPQPLAPNLPLFQIDRFQALAGDVDFRLGYEFGVEAEDLVLFSWPTDYQVILRRLDPGTAHERVIHIVQNTRHANPHWLGGYPLRLLGRPMARIMVAEEVLAACRRWLNPRSLTRVIPEGHDWPYFARERGDGLSSPLRVAYTTWKSSVGAEVEQALADDARFSFRSITTTVGWSDLRDLYHWADVFLACPNPQEGFYLPGLETMAAGALLVTPDVGGNRAYCRFGENCVLVDFDSKSSYVGALQRVVEMPGPRVEAMRNAGYRVLKDHTLEEERRLFAEFLAEVEERTSPGSRRSLGGGSLQPL